MVTYPRYGKKMPKQPPKAKAPKRMGGKDPRRLYAWTKRSKQYRKDNPCCERCIHLEELSQVSFDNLSVHHIIGIKKAPHLFWESSNLLSLCVPCHKYFDGLERTNKIGQAEFEGKEIKGR